MNDETTDFNQTIIDEFRANNGDVGGQVANPDEIGAETLHLRARVAEPDEGDPSWKRQKADYPGFADYEARTDRIIPVVILEDT